MVWQKCSGIRRSYLGVFAAAASAARSPNARRRPVAALGISAAAVSPVERYIGLPWAYWW
ncbi:hypothetical protein [Sodalis sp. (in: enterobacteria)]|uniref:hypothetical protein n=1 Tax=Sodalis sp. (in: enterobacteria) TaxID=1898979 RepID=UPI003F38210F